MQIIFIFIIKYNFLLVKKLEFQAITFKFFGFVGTVFGPKFRNNVVYPVLMLTKYHGFYFIVPSVSGTKQRTRTRKKQNKNHSGTVKIL